MRKYVFFLLLVSSQNTLAAEDDPSSRAYFNKKVQKYKGLELMAALGKVVDPNEAIAATVSSLATRFPEAVRNFFHMLDESPKGAVQEEVLKTLGLATEEATAKAREESATALAALTSEKQALQARNEDLRREIDTLKATLGSRIAGLEVQIAEERKRTRAEQDRVEEVARDRATTGRTADAEKARLGEQIRELQKRLERTEAELAQYKEMFTDQLGTIAQLDGWGDISETQLRARIKETQRKKKPSSLASDTASITPQSTPAGSLMGTPVGGLTAPRGPATPTGPLMGTPVGGGTTPRSSLLKTLKDKLSGLKSGSENTLQPQVSPVGTSSKPFVPPFVSPIVPSRTVDGTDSLPTSLESAPEGGSGGKGRRKPSLTVGTGQQSTDGVTEEDPDA